MKGIKNMATEIYLGNPPENIKKWIKADYNKKLTKVVYTDGTNWEGIIKNKDFRLESIPNYNNIAVISVGNNIVELQDFALDNEETDSVITKIALPESIFAINYNGLGNNVQLTSLNIPDSVEDIYGIPSTPYPNLSYDTTTIPGVKMIDGWIFGYDEENPPTTLNLSKCKGIAGQSLESCESLTSITIPDNIKSIGSVAYVSENYKYDTTTIPGVKMIDGYACRVEDTDYQHHPYDIDLSKCKGIAQDCFSGSINLTSIILPEKINFIGSWAFADTYISSIILPNNLKNIYSNTFCFTDLTSITIPDSVKNIGQYAFTGSWQLSSIFIPSTIQYIGSYAFEWCPIESLPNSTTSQVEQWFSESIFGDGSNESYDNPMDLTITCKDGIVHAIGIWNGEYSEGWTIEITTF